MTGFLFPRLVGRTTQLRTLDALLAAAARGRGTAHAFVAEAGLGKSRLVRATAAAAHAGGVVISTGRCVEGPAAAPLRPLSEAVTALVRRGTTPAGPTLTPYLPVLARLAPDLLPGEPAATSPDPDPVHLGEGLLRLLATQAGGRGALLVVEDLHAADPLTLATLEYVTDALAAPEAQAPVSLLLTLRPEPSAGHDLVRSLAARRSLQTTTLAALTDAEMAELVRSCGPQLPDTVVDAVVRRAAGVPFLAEELLSAAADELGQVHPDRVVEVVPLSLADAVQRRLAALEPDVHDLLRFAAVVGEQADPALLAAATGRTREEVVRSLAPARVAQLLATDEPCAFRHVLTRDAVLAGILPSERAAHARALLRAAGAAGTEPAVLARLADTAGDDDAAARAWLAVAEEAIGRGLPGGAETALQRAQARARSAGDLDLETTVAQSRLAALALAGQAEQVLQLCDRLRAEETFTGPPRRGLHLHAARAALDAGRHERAERELQGCRAGDASALALGALVALADGRLAQARDRAQRVLALPDAPATAVCEAWEVMGRLRRPTDLHGAAAAFAAAHATARAAGLALWEVRALHELGTVDMFLSGRPDRLEEAHRAATALGALTTRAVLDVQLAGCLALALDTSAALDRAAAAAVVAGQTGAQPLAAAAATATALAHSYAGRWSEAEREAARALVLSEDDPETGAMLAGLGDGIGGLLAEDRQRARRGFEQLAELAPHAPSMPPTPAPALRVLLGAVEQSAWSGSPRVAAEAAGVEAVPYNALLLAYADAVELGRSGHGAAARRRVEAAEEDLRAVRPGAAVEHLRYLGIRLTAEAAQRDGWGEPVLWLREVVAHFEDPAPAVAGAARTLLREAGARAPRRGGARQVPERLRAAGVTAREHEVLLLVATGSPNREIAERLHLSVRTVETHVARLLAKTGATSRGGLSEWAADVGGDETKVRSRP